MRVPLALLTLLVGSAILPARAQITISVNPAETQATSAGNTFNVEVRFQDYTDLYSYRVELFYNPAALTHTAITKGPILNSAGSDFFLTSGSSAPNGRVLVDHSVLGPLSGVSGSDAVAFTVTFQAVATGGSDLFYGDMRVRNSSNVALAYTLEEGRGTVVSPLPDESASLRFASASTSAVFQDFGATGVAARVTSSGNGGTITAMRYDAEPPGGDAAPFTDPDGTVAALDVTDAYWEVTSSLSGSINVDLAFVYTGLDGPADPTEYRVARRSLGSTASDPWTLLPSSVTSVDIAESAVRIDGGVGTYGSSQYALVASLPYASLTGGEGWRMFGMTAVGQTYDAYLGPLWTQGFPGADAVQDDPFFCNAFAYDPLWVNDDPLDYNGDGVVSPRDGWRCIPNQTAAFGQGEAMMVFVFADDDFDGAPEGFPKSVLIPTPYASAPHTFTGLTYADGPAVAAADEGFNLRGNPLGEPFDWDALSDGVDYGDVSGTIYVYDPTYNLGDYRTRNGGTGDLTDGLVPSFQGFLVQATGPSPSLTIPVVAVGGAQPYYGRTAAPKVVRLELRDRDGDVPVAASFVRFDEDADAGVDRLDSYRLAPFRWPSVTLASQPLVGTDTNGDGVDEYPALVQNALPLPTSEPTSVPLVVTAAGQTSETVALRLVWEGLDTLPDSWLVELRDELTGTVVDLTLAGTYDFDVTPATAANVGTGPGPSVVASSSPRFALVVTDEAGVAIEPSASAPTIELSAEPNPASTHASVAFALPEAGPVHLALFDLLGRRVQMLVDGSMAAGHHQVPLPTFGLPDGLYVLRLATPSGVATSKLTVVR